MENTSSILFMSSMTFMPEYSRQKEGLKEKRRKAYLNSRRMSFLKKKLGNQKVMLVEYSCRINYALNYWIIQQIFDPISWNKIIKDFGSCRKIAGISFNTNWIRTPKQIESWTHFLMYGSPFTVLLKELFCSLIIQSFFPPSFRCWFTQINLNSFKLK